MSELTNARNGWQNFRRQLLTTASALALLAAVYGSSEAQAADQDADRPTVWIELGGQLSALEDAQQLALPFVPDFSGGKSPLEAEKPLPFSFNKDAKISFLPDGSDWVFSGAIQFGRASANRHQHLQTANKNIPISTTRFSRHYSVYFTHHVRFSDNITSQSESHAIIDFLVGKDVGLGMFGSSIVSGGVRIAQFSSKSNVNLRAEPDVQYYPKTLPKTFPAFYQFRRMEDVHFHDYAQTAARKESFHGIGPKLDWSASTPISGNDTDNGEIALDWGANMSVLFGRQKAKVHHQTAVNSYYLKSNNFFPGPGYVFGGPHNLKDGAGYNRPFCASHVTGGESYTNCRTRPPPTAHHTNGAYHNRSRMVAVTNMGGFAGLSFRYADAKISLGYRADFFFGAMDGGIDTAKKENVGFYGPFASVSVGLGG